MVVPSYKKFSLLCDSSGISEAIISKKTEIPQSTFSDWKKGKSSPKIDKIWRISKFFKICIEDLLEEV